MSHQHIYISSLYPIPWEHPPVLDVLAEINRIYPGNPPSWAWPNRRKTLFTITGPKVTPRQAAEIIRRTDMALWYLSRDFTPPMFPNPDNANMQRIAELVSAPPGKPRNCTHDEFKAHDQECLRWASAWGWLCHSTFHQYFVRSSYPDQFLGWCHPVGTVAYVGYIESDPHAHMLVHSLFELAFCFPWLTLEVGAYRWDDYGQDETGDEGTPVAVAGLRLNKGTVTAVKLHGDSNEEREAYFTPIYEAQASAPYEYDGDQCNRERSFWDIEKDGPFPDKPIFFYWSVSELAELWKPHIERMRQWRAEGTPVMPCVPSPDPEENP